MKRRSFLRLAGAVAAVGMVAPAAVKFCSDPWCDSIAGEGIIPHDELHKEVQCPSTEEFIAEYADYANFSAFAIATAIDASVSETAAQLSLQSGRAIANLL